MYGCGIEKAVRRYRFVRVYFKQIVCSLSGSLDVIGLLETRF